MIFKKIELAGFKSFADKRNIVFEDGVTAIVGPNGCGKSNVSDAIRWVLGEQSNKILRSKTMQDVIFKGTEKRKSLSYCEVSLFFDNTTRVFNLDIDEIVITRKLYRSGTSDYLLNNNNVRLKDITDLLHDSGIGREGYSIIGQGRVEQIINSKPEDRRGIFEEAAGVAKFKAKKKETESKLERVRDNLTRQADIMKEVERQIGPLKKQSEDAKKCLEFKHNLRHHEINTYIAQHESTNETKQKISNVIEGVQEEIALRQSDLEKQNRKYSSALEKQQTADIAMKELNEEILNLSLSLQKLDSDNEIIKERINFINAEIERNEIAIKDGEKFIFEQTNELNRATTSLETDKVELTRLNAKYQEVANLYVKATQELTQNEGANEEANSQVIDALEKLTEIKANFSKLTTEKNVLAENVAENEKKLIILQQKFAENKNILDEISLSNSGVDVRKLDLEKKVEMHRKETEELELQMKLLEKEVHDISTEFKLKKDRFNLIQTMQADFEGYASSVQKLLKASKTNLNLSQNIVGIVGQLITVPKEYETAIEISLGNAIHNIVTNNESEAQILIDYLKKNEFGRATFLPITSMKPRFIEKNILEELKKEEICGIASELINYDKKIKSIMASLLGLTVIVQNLETAVKIAKKFNYSFKIVTLAGDVLSPAGSMTGGSKKSTYGNLLSRDRELENLKTDIENLQRDIELKTAELDKFSEDYQKSKHALETNEIALNKLNIDFAGVFEKRARYEDFNSRLASEIDDYKNSIETNNERIKQITEELESVDRLENVVNSNITKANESTKTFNSKYDEIKRQKEELTNTLSQIRVEIASKEYAILNNEKDIERLNENINSQKSIIQLNSQEVENKKNQINSIMSRNQSSVDKIEIKEKQEALIECKKQIAQLEEGKKILQETLIEIEESRNSLIQNVSALEKKKVTYEMQLQKVDIDLSNMQERIYEEYELTYQTCLEFRVADYDMKLGISQIADLKKEINKLGPVNINAIEEYKSVCERYEYLTEQTNDALKAEAELVEIINDLSKEMVTRFNDAFEIINKNFTKIFSELFGGGRATLELVDNEDPLEAGIEIQAEPPGKKLQTMTLLSGGEKALTAIAILFAILKLRPMPFCLLDEIEAALDDANVVRFAKYLKKFSQETQFIVITHRKPTMELADRLFGVTMEEPGVSKVVSVNLSEAMKTAEDN